MMKILNQTDCLLIQGGVCQRVDKEGSDIIVFVCDDFVDDMSSVMAAGRAAHKEHDKPVKIYWKNKNDSRYSGEMQIG